MPVLEGKYEEAIWLWLSFGPQVLARCAPPGLVNLRKPTPQICHWEWRGIRRSVCSEIRGKIRDQFNSRAYTGFIGDGTGIRRTRLPKHGRATGGHKGGGP